jgi:glycogen debranching enzyme
VAISEFGMLKEYYDRTKDKEMLRFCFGPICEYLQLWKTDSEGVVKRRRGSWEWYDHGPEVDARLLSVCLYYSAVKYAQRVAKELANTTFDAFLAQRAKAIEDTFEARFWKDTVYRGSPAPDDRSSAWAVLSGLAKKEHYPGVLSVLNGTFHSTPYMENFVLTALCEMGQKDLAFARMMKRYAVVIDDKDYTTVPEDFAWFGTHNHAWSGGPLTIVCRYFPELIKKGSK